MSDLARTLTSLAREAGVTPRTVRYYIAQGLIPSPGQAGPGAHYTEGHLARLRLIRQLQRQHLPLAEIRRRVGQLQDAQVLQLLEPAAGPPAGSAVDYIRTVLSGGRPGDHPSPSRALFTAASIPPRPDHRPASFGVREASLAFGGEAGPAAAAPAGREAERPEPTASQAATSQAAGLVTERSQWDRISLTPDVELHLRRPLSRVENRRVERLIAFARDLLEED